MGIHGNSTCVMNYDEATGYLLGEANGGLKAMFTMMNEARLGVGLQGLSLGEVAYQNAAAYASERLQGRSLSGPKAPDKPADPIIVHPDIRRTLMTMKAFNEAGRALVLWTAIKSDVAHRSGDDKDRQAADDLLGLMTPIVKGVLTDKGFDHAVMAQQVFGGHGYIEEHGMSQFVRDARIAMIYEGANGIQALDLVGRKLGAEWRPRRAGLLQGGRRVLRGKPRRREDGAVHQGAEEGPQRPAGGDHVADAERHGQARQCRRRLDRLSCISSAWSRSATCGRRWRRPRRRKLADGADGAASFYENKLVTGRYLHGARDAGDVGASRPHFDRRRHDDGAAGGGVLRRDAARHAVLFKLNCLAIHGSEEQSVTTNPAEILGLPKPAWAARMSACSTTWRTRFLAEEIAPRYDEFEKNEMVDRASWEKAGAAGLLCASMPEEYGGSGGTFAHESAIIEAIGHVGVDGFGIALHNAIVAPYILHYGSEEQKKKWLPKMATGELIGAIAMTEPGAGSDLQGVKTRAEKDGNHYRINGSKTFITNGQLANLIIVVTKTDPARAPRAPR